MNVETCYSVFVLIRAKYVVNVEKSSATAIINSQVTVTMEKWRAVNINIDSVNDPILNPL